MHDSNPLADENPYQSPRAESAPATRTPQLLEITVSLIAFVLHLASAACVMSGIAAMFLGAIVTFAGPWAAIAPSVCMVGGAILSLLGIAMRLVQNRF